MNAKQIVYYEVKMEDPETNNIHYVDRKFKNIEEIKKLFNFEDSYSKFTVTRVVTEKTEIITQ